MVLNNRQFQPESLAALQRLADIPTYQQASNWDPSKSTPEEYRHHLDQGRKYHEETVKPWADHTFALMEKERIPQHPKLRENYDKGKLLPQEYAQELLVYLSHA